MESPIQTRQGKSKGCKQARKKGSPSSYVAVEVDVVVVGGGGDKSWLNLHAAILGCKLFTASSPL
jgi:hypothetical protein